VSRFCGTVARDRLTLAGQRGKVSRERSAMALLRMDNVSIVVENLAATVAFFSELGLATVRWPGADGAPGGAFCLHRPPRWRRAGGTTGAKCRAMPPAVSSDTKKVP
jgi:hypothetical protein